MLFPGNNDSLITACSAKKLFIQLHFSWINCYLATNITWVLAPSSIVVNNWISYYFPHCHSFNLSQGVIRLRSADCLHSHLDFHTTVQVHCPDHARFPKTAFHMPTHMSCPPLALAPIAYYGLFLCASCFNITHMRDSNQEMRVSIFTPTAIC